MYSNLPLTRCPLLMVDEHGKERKVFIGPETIHDHDGPNHDSLYMENNDLTFSSWDDGCGSIDIGSYGPFFESDIKNEVQYELKNFLFDFEPQGKLARHAVTLFGYLATRFANTPYLRLELWIKR